MIFLKGKVVLARALPERPRCSGGVDFGGKIDLLLGRPLNDLLKREREMIQMLGYVICVAVFLFCVIYAIPAFFAHLVKPYRYRKIKGTVQQVGWVEENRNNKYGTYFTSHDVVFKTDAGQTLRYDVVACGPSIQMGEAMHIGSSGTWVVDEQDTVGQNGIRIQRVFAFYDGNKEILSRQDSLRFTAMNPTAQIKMRFCVMFTFVPLIIFHLINAFLIQFFIEKLPMLFWFPLTFGSVFIYVYLSKVFFGRIDTRNFENLQSMMPNNHTSTVS